MATSNPNLCPQVRRALSLLIPTDAHKIDRTAMAKAMGQPTPTDWEPLIALIIQIILTLLENKPDPEPDNPPDPNDPLSNLRKIVRDVATKTIPAGTLKHDRPRLIASIESIASLIPCVGFENTSDARTAMRVANNEALGFTARQWSTWNDDVRAELDQLHAAGHFNKIQDYPMVWLAIAEELESIE